jgi:hypothetical protein
MPFSAMLLEVTTVPEKPLLCVKSNLNPDGSSALKHPVTIGVYSQKISLTAFLAREEYLVDSILDLFVDEPRRVTVIDFEKNGNRFRRELSEDDFPGLAAGMLALLESGWGGLNDKNKSDAAEVSVVQGIERRKPLSRHSGKPLIHLKRKLKNDPGGKRLRSVKVYSYGITLASAREKTHYPLDKIHDVFLTLQPVNFEKIVVINAKAPNGKWVHLKLFEYDFPGLQNEMAQVLERGWGGFCKKRNTSNAVVWLHAVCAINAVFQERNPFVYAYTVKNPEFLESERERVTDAWQVQDRESLMREMVYLSCGILYYQTLHPGISQAEKAARADSLNVYVMSAVIALSFEGYICEWLSYEESLAWCIEAGRRLQTRSDGWDSYAQRMLESFDIFARDDAIIVPDSAGLNVYLKEDYLANINRDSYRSAYEHLSQLPWSPWQIPWDAPLILETGPAINAEKRKLPQNFSYMPELNFMSAKSANAFRKPLHELAQSIESGLFSLLDVNVKLHFAVGTMLRLQATSSHTHDYIDSKLAKNSFCQTANNIFKFFNIDLDALEVWRMNYPLKREN